MVRLPDQLADLEVLGPAEPTGDLLGSVVRAALRDDSAEVLGAAAVATGYPFTSIATGGLFRVSGTASTTAGERRWSAFVKVLQHPRHWPLIDHVPPQAAAEILELFPWREGLDTHERMLPVLPPGLRVPDVYAVADLDDDRLAWWMEDVDVDDDAWTDERYARAAHLLARLAARRTAGTAAGPVTWPRGSRSARSWTRVARCWPLRWPTTPSGPGRWSPTPSTPATAPISPGRWGRCRTCSTRWTPSRSPCRTATRRR